MKLLPNTRVGEAQLAEELGVSRTPIREAINRLVGEGLVDARARAGNVVSPIRIDAVKAAQFVREKLEVGVMRRVATGSTEYFKFSLKQAISEQEFAIQNGDTSLFFESDENMHKSFADIAGLPSVWPVIREAKTHLDRVRWLSLGRINAKALLQDHRELLTAIEREDPDTAQATLERHLRRATDLIEDMRSEHPDFFETQSCLRKMTE